MTSSYPTDDNENRVRGVVDDLIGVETPDDIMENLIGVLSEGPKIATVGKYYTNFFILPRHQEFNMMNILLWQ